MYTSNTGNACRKIATIRLPKEFTSPQVAEKELEKQMDTATTAAATTTQCAMSEHDTSKSMYLSETEFTKNMNVLMSKVKDEEKCSALSLLYSKLADSHGLKIPNDYLQLSLSAMKHLRESGRANVLYKLAKAIGEVRCDESDTKLPCKQMPMGLLEHIANFFTAEFHQQVCYIYIYSLK